MKLKLVALIEVICLITSQVAMTASATTPSTLIENYEYSYNYTHIDFEKRTSWVDTSRYHYFAYDFGSGKITIEKSGIGSNGQSAKLDATGTNDTQTQINDIRAQVAKGLVVYSMDVLFKDFNTTKRFYINSLLDNGAYGWNLGGLRVSPTGTNESWFETAGCVEGVKSNKIKINQWYTIRLAVDLDNKKMYYFLDDTLITSASFSRIKEVYRLSLANITTTKGSVMYLDNVDITCYSHTENTPSVFESTDDIKSKLLGFSAFHSESGCIIKEDGTKFLSDKIPYNLSNGHIMVDASVIEALFGVDSISGDIYSETKDGTGFYSLTECASKFGKTIVSNDSTANGKFYIIGNSAFSMPSGNDLQRLSDYIFYWRPEANDIKTLYNNSNVSGAHPRLFASNKDFDILRAMSNTTGSDMESLKNALLKSADTCVKNNDIVAYRKNPGDDLRMNFEASDFDLYMYTVAVAWQAVKDTDAARAKLYADYAWRQMNAVATFPDWNPMHRIDHGIFASGYAVGYDIMYDAWTDEQRKIIEEGAMKNGIEHYMKVYQVTYGPMRDAAYCNDNHNSIINGDAILLGLAFMDVYPEECSYIVANAMRALENVLLGFAPEGGWAEGVYYSCLNMQYLCPALEALEDVFGSCLGLDKVSGFDGAGDFIEVAQSDVSIYNFADSDSGNYTVELWYQNHFGRDCIDDLKEIASGSINRGINEAKAYLAGAEISDEATRRPLDMIFENTQLIAMHDSYDDGQTFVGIKAGTTQYVWSHLDSGSFVFDAMGVRWAHDMGKDDYNLPDYHNPSGDRWKVFLTRAESHNTVIVDPDMNTDYVVGSNAPITEFKTTEENGIVKIDTSALYGGRLSDAKRVFCYTDNRKSLVIRDELTTLQGKTSDIYWMLYTKAGAVIDTANKRVILTDKNDSSKKIMVEYLCNADFDIIYEDAKPLEGTPVVEGQKTNEGFYRLALKTKATGDVNITVKLTPMNLMATSIDNYDCSIENWSTDMDVSNGAYVWVDNSVVSGTAYAVIAEYDENNEMTDVNLTSINHGANVGKMTISSDVKNDLEANWTEADLVDESNFDSLSTLPGTWIGNLTHRNGGTWSLDSNVKKGHSGKSILVSSGSSTADLRFYLTNAFSASGISGSVYKLSYDFNLTDLPTADIFRNTLVFTKSGSISNYLAGIQIAKDGTGNILVNEVETGYSLNAGQWHNIAYVYDTTTHIYECYFDGNLVHRDVISSTSPDAFHEMQMSFKSHDMYLDNIELSTLSAADISVDNGKIQKDRTYKFMIVDAESIAPLVKSSKIQTK